MSKTTIKSNRLISVLLCSLFLPISSCVNKLDSETSPGTTPITFSTKINKTSTRVTNTTSRKEIKWDYTQCYPPLLLQKKGISTICS